MAYPWSSQVMSPHHPGQVSQNSQVSSTAVKVLHNVEVKSSIWTSGNFQMAVSRKRNKLPEIRWSQYSRIVQGFHPLFHESDLAPLFHPLSASFLKETTLSGCSRCHNLSQNGSEYAPGTPFHVGKKKFTGHPKMRGGL